MAMDYTPRHEDAVLTAPHCIGHAMQHYNAEVDALSATQELLLMMHCGAVLINRPVCGKETISEGERYVLHCGLR